MFGIRQGHLIGLLAGAALGAVLAGLGSALGYSLALSDGLFWGAIIGGVLAGMPQFARSGAVLTRREGRVLNTLVGLVGGLLLLGVVAGLVFLLLRLLF